MTPRAAQALRTSLLLVGALGAGWLGARIGGPGDAARSPAPDTGAATERAAAERPSARPPSVMTGLPTARAVTRRVVTREVPVFASHEELLDGADSPDARVTRARALLRSADAADRTEGLNLLYSLDPAQAVDQARTLLHDKDADLAIPAARVLTMEKQIGAEDYEALGSMMADGGLEPEARTGATGALMSALRITESEDIGRWYDTALQSDVAWVRGSAVANVAALPTEQAVPLLAKALGDADPQVANGAMMALTHGHGGDEKLGKDPAAWAGWLADRKAAVEKKAADDYAMRNPVIEQRPEDDKPTDEYPPTLDQPVVSDTPSQE